MGLKSDWTKTPNNVGNYRKKYLTDSDVDNIMEIRDGSDLLSYGSTSGAGPHVLIT